jgi:hypothetical protein
VDGRAGEFVPGDGIEVRAVRGKQAKKAHALITRVARLLVPELLYQYRVDTDYKEE